MTSAVGPPAGVVRRAVLDLHLSHPAVMTSLADFTLGPAAPAAADVALTPGWSLYSFELDEPRAAVFVRTDGPLDLSGSFLMNQQRVGAREVLVVPEQDFHELAAGLAPPSSLAFLFSTGRCGSTLASRILGTLPGVVSLSEPDVYTNLVQARATLPLDEATALLRAATAVLCHGVGVTAGDHVVVKPRSEPVLDEHAYAVAFPEARHAFMYRDVVAYTRSLTRYARRLVGELPAVPMGEQLSAWNQLSACEPLSTLGRVLDLDRTDIGFHELLPSVWALRIQAHLAAVARAETPGSIEAIHYDDLVADREQETARLLAACGIDPDHTRGVLSVFERDAHAGMAGSNETRVRGLDDDELDQIMRQLPNLGVDAYERQRL